MVSQVYVHQFDVQALVQKYINLHWKKFTFRFYPGMKMGEIFALVETKVIMLDISNKKKRLLCKSLI